MGKHGPWSPASKTAEIDVPLRAFGKYPQATLEFMKTHLIALVVAALFAAIATQTYLMLFVDGNRIALLALCFIAAALSALVTVRFAARQRPVSVAPSRTRRSQASRPPARERQPDPPADAERERGVVKWFDVNKGYGFIIRAGGDEIFVHHRSIRRGGSGRRGFDDGQEVNFIAVERQRGWEAEDVVPE